MTPEQWRLVTENDGLVFAMAVRVLGHGNVRDEHIDYGRDALISAASNFNAGRGVRFSTYACRAIIRRISLARSRMMRREKQFHTCATVADEGTHSLPWDTFSHDPRQYDSEHEQLPAMKRHLRRLRREAPSLWHVVVSHYGIGREPQTLAEIGTPLKLCRERVRQLEVKAIRLIRKWDMEHQESA